MKSKVRKREEGYTIVEATFVFPIITLIILALFYVAIFLCQRAILQSNLQTALLYYKNVESDNYIEATAEYGSLYGEPKRLFPYRNFMTHFNESGFIGYFHRISGEMFFSSAGNIEVSANEYNYLVVKVLEATATQTIHPSVNFSLVGGPGDMTIQVSAKAIINDSDELIRNTDFVGKLIMDSPLGEYITSGREKIKNAYNKLKETVGI